MQGLLPATIRISVGKGRNDTAVIARSFFPLIEAACQVQIDKLKKAGDKLSIAKAKQIKLAVDRMDQLITDKHQISQPNIIGIMQENHTQDMALLFKADFSTPEKVLAYQYTEMWWDRTFYLTRDPKDVHASPSDGITVSHSIKEALNISLRNPFNYSLFFAPEAYYGPFWGNGKMYYEVVTDITSKIAPKKEIKEDKLGSVSMRPG